MSAGKGKGVERRSLTRVVKRISATFVAGPVRGKGHIKNVSKRGMFLRTIQIPEVGTPVRVTFRDRDGSTVEVNGTVHWTTKQLPASSKAQPGFGIQIPADSQEFTEFFERILFS